MVTVKSRDFSYTNRKDKIEGECLSTDTKPTIYANGSVLIEMDTGKIYMFNEEGLEWVEIA